MVKPCWALLALILWVAFASFGFRGFNAEWKSRNYRRITVVSQAEWAKRDCRRYIQLCVADECHFTYNYTVDGKRYSGNRAYFYKMRGSDELCERMGLRRCDFSNPSSKLECEAKLRKKMPMFYDPNHPKMSTLIIETTPKRTVVLVFFSWLVLSLMVSFSEFKLHVIPVIYGLVSGGFLLALGIHRLPKSGPYFITGIVLLVYALLGPFLDIVFQKHCYNFINYF